MRPKETRRPQAALTTTYVIRTTNVKGKNESRLPSEIPVARRSAGSRYTDSTSTTPGTRSFSSRSIPFLIVIVDIGHPWQAPSS